jgi:hypothetical protein
MALRPLDRRSVSSALSDQPPLKLSEGGHHVGHHLPLRGCGIDAEVQGGEALALPLAGLHEPGEVEDRSEKTTLFVVNPDRPLPSRRHPLPRPGAAESIEFGHYQRAGAGTHRSKGGRQARPGLGSYGP